MKTSSMLLSTVLGASCLMSANVMAEKPFNPSCAPKEMQAKMQARQAKMQAMMAAHHAQLKAELKLTPAQEPAWNGFLASLKPPAPPVMSQEECNKMKADKANMTQEQMMQQHILEMDKHKVELQARLDAIKNFKAKLTPEQVKAFDAHQQQMMQMGKAHQKMMMNTMPGMNHPMPAPK